jgi:hypothetical protein
VKDNFKKTTIWKIRNNLFYSRCFISDGNIATSAHRAVKINQDRERRKKSSQASAKVAVSNKFECRKPIIDNPTTIGFS